MSRFPTYAIEERSQFQRPSSLEYDQTIFGTFYDYPMIAWTDPRTNETDYYPATRAYINGVVLHIIVPVFAHAQSLFLTAVAVNRFSALCFPLKHAIFWSSRRVAVVVITLTVMAVLLGAGLPVVTLIRQYVVCSAANEKESEALSCYRTWALTQVSGIRKGDRGRLFFSGFYPLR